MAIATTLAMKAARMVTAMAATTKATTMMTMMTVMKMTLLLMHMSMEFIGWLDFHRSHEFDTGYRLSVTRCCAQVCSGT